MERQSSTDRIDSSGTAENKESQMLKNSGVDLNENSHVYRDDIVKSIKRESMLGIVVGVSGDTDSDNSFSDDESGDDTASESNDDLTAGQVRILWHDGSETTNSVDELCVVDRGFFPGDVVSLAEDSTDQLGLVLDVDITVDLLSPTGELIANVSHRDLRRFQEFSVDDYVVCGSWLGRVDDMVENVTVLFDDGSSCQTLEADPSTLKPVSKGIIDDADFPYYPGQRVRSTSPHVFKRSRWLSGSWNINRCEATVTKVEVKLLFINWLTSANPSDGDNRDDVPSEKQIPENVTLLPFFNYASWELGDWCFTTKHNERNEYEKAFLIANITTKVDVAWQDGTKKFQLDSRLLLPINNPGELNFFPEQYVIHNKDFIKNDNGFSPEMNRVGIVRHVNANRRRACVKWLNPVSRPGDFREFDKEEIVCVDELDSHPDYDYCYGDVVARVSLVPIPSSSATSRVHVEEQEQHHGSYIDASNLSWFGHIIGLNDGSIEVAWGDGLVSKVGPRAIFVVDEEDDDDSSIGGSETSDSGSWETVELDTLDTAEMESAFRSTTIASGGKREL